MKHLFALLTAICLVIVVYMTAPLAWRQAVEQMNFLMGSGVVFPMLGLMVCGSLVIYFTEES